MDNLFCLTYGPVITVVVSLLKGIPFVNAHSKSTALLLSIMATLIPLLLPHADPMTVSQITSCVLQKWGTAVLTFELAKSAGVAGSPPSAPTSKESSNRPSSSASSNASRNTSTTINPS